MVKVVKAVCVDWDEFNALHCAPPNNQNNPLTKSTAINHAAITLTISVDCAVIRGNTVSGVTTRTFSSCAQCEENRSFAPCTVSWSANVSRLYSALLIFSPVGVTVVLRGVW